MNEMINKIGERLVNKGKLVNRYLQSCEADENKRKNPFYSEFQGMLQLLKAMDMDYEIEWDAEVKLMTAITVMGKQFEI